MKKRRKKGQRNPPGINQKDIANVSRQMKKEAFWTDLKPPTKFRGRKWRSGGDGGIFTKDAKDRFWTERKGRRK